MRLIDADAFKAYMRNALEQTRDVYPDRGEWAETITKQFCIDIDEQPTIEAQPKTGRWIVYEVANTEEEQPIAWQCSNCEEVVDCRYNFCPHCGSMMLKEGEEHETD